ncbi:MAG: GPW/gp25 family protein [Acetobacteraceae bacterium]|nr:GPW/gp25 family protein [Acetobacteraceae bacterium]
MAVAPQANLGVDLALERVDERALSIYRLRETAARRVEGGRGVTLRDFALAEGRDNLGQALAARLLTPRGEIAALGHAAYGSRLHEVIGQPNTPTTRNLAKLFVIEALKQERRVEAIASVEVTPHPANRFLILVAIEVKPVGSEAVLALAFGLEL